MLVAYLLFFALCWTLLYGPLQAITRRHRWLLALILLLWPFVYMYRYTLVGYDFSLTIGNDFHRLYYIYKPYLLDVISNQGRIPLWSPSEAAGFPFYANPFTQTFYPLNIPLVFVYKLFGGYSAYMHQLFTLFGVSIFTLGIYTFLRTLRIDYRVAFLVALVVGTSFKITELVRFPNAVHAAAWLPWLLAGMTLVMYKRRWAGGLLAGLSLIMLITAGYPYYVYYLIFIVPFWYLFLISPWFEHITGKARQLSWPKYTLYTGLSLLLAALLCLPYLLHMYELLAQTTDRAGGDWAYSTQHLFTYKDIFGSLAFPPVAESYGWYYFGQAALFILLLWIIHLFMRFRQSRCELIFLGLTFIWLALITSISFAGHSLTFKALWHSLPGFSSLRTWGRINILLLPLLALWLARAFSFFMDQNNKRTAQIKHRQSLLVFAGTYTALLLAQILLNTEAHYVNGWKFYFNTKPEWDKFGDYQMRGGERMDESFFIYIGLISFAFVIAYQLLGRTIRNTKILTGLFVSLLALNSYDTGKIGSKQWFFKKQPSTKLKEYKIGQACMASFETPRYFGPTINLNRQFYVGYVQNWYFSEYIELLHKYGVRQGFETVTERSKYLAYLMGIIDGQRFFYSDKIYGLSVEEYVNHSLDYAKKAKLQIGVISYNGDRLEMLATANKPGYLSFIDNNAPGWKAYVDGKQVRIHELFSCFKTVYLEAGEHKIVFSYEPALF